MYTNESLKEKCNRCKIDYETAMAYSQNNPELTNEEVIIHFRPDCYINILGEIVIPEED